jgi:hypothetical protein
MKIKLPSIVYFVLLSILINACNKGCPESKPIERGVDKSYLPYIIPYSDTNTRLFLKNGKDTLLFKSQGLKETITNEQAGEGSCNNYNLQKYSLKMAASDSDYYEIMYYTSRKWSFAVVKFNMFSDTYYDETQEYTYEYFKEYTNHPPIVKRNILNQFYDSVYVLPIFGGNINELIVKPEIGVLKIRTSKTTLELIK